MKILITEDDPLMLVALEHQLKQEKYIVYKANNGREAVQLFEKVKPDLIITDILMPFISGLELIGIVRSTFSTHIPIIVLSSVDEENTVLEAFGLGADDFLTKPMKAGELNIRVKRLLAKKESSAS